MLEDILILATQRLGSEQRTDPMADKAYVEKLARGLPETKALMNSSIRMWEMGVSEAIKTVDMVKRELLWLAET